MYQPTINLISQAWLQHVHAVSDRYWDRYPSSEAHHFVAQDMLSGEMQIWY